MTKGEHIYTLLKISMGNNKCRRNKINEKNTFKNSCKYVKLSIF